MANGLSQRNKTMGELMGELRARLSFATQGSASRNNDAIIKSFLQEAHDFVFDALIPSDMRKKCTITLQAGSFLYDWNNDAEDELIDPTRVQSVWLVESDTIRTPMTQGISEYDRSLSSTRERPTKYDTLNGQLEVAPVPDRAYTMLIEYTASKGRFDRTNDRPSVPDRLVFLYALANAKAHYRHPDAQASASTFQRMLELAKSRQKENRRYFAGAASEAPSESYVVKSAAGYTLGAR